MGAQVGGVTLGVLCAHARVMQSSWQTQLISSGALATDAAPRLNRQALSSTRLSRLSAGVAGASTTANHRLGPPPSAGDPVSRQAAPAGAPRSHWHSTLRLPYRLTPVPSASHVHSPHGSLVVKSIARRLPPRRGACIVKPPSGGAVHVMSGGVGNRRDGVVLHDAHRSVRGLLPHAGSTGIHAPHSTTLPRHTRTARPEPLARPLPNARPYAPATTP